MVNKYYIQHNLCQNETIDASKDILHNYCGETLVSANKLLCKQAFTQSVSYSHYSRLPLAIK